MIIFLFPLICISKTIKSAIELGEETPAQYITKFGVDAGSGHWEFKAKIVRNRRSYAKGRHFELALLLYKDSDWNDSAFKCESLSKATEHSIKLPADGLWSDTFTGTLGEHNEPHIWFFMLGDCSHQFNEEVRIKIELSIQSADRSEFSIESKGMKENYIIVCLLYCVLLGRNVFRLYKHFNEEEEIEATLVMLNVAVVCRLFSMFFYILHLSAYESNGYGVAAFDFFGSSGGLISDFMLIFLLLLVAQGWSITFREFPDPEVYISIMIILGFLHFCISAIEVVYSDSHYLYSPYDGIVSWVVLLIRVILLLWFYWNLIDLTEKVPQATKIFLKRFATASTIYILALPNIIFFAKLFPPYQQHKFIIAANLAIQGLAILSLSWLFTSKSQLYKISMIARSILPGKKHNY